MILTIYTDGGARKNPGPAAIGVAAYQQPTTNNQQLFTISKYIGVATNNEAEYQAVIEALQWLVDNISNIGEQPEKIRFFIDSVLVVNQINGKFKIKKAHLRELFVKVRNLENQIQAPITYTRIPREKNVEADALVNKALDEHEQSNRNNNL
jgi:ribonuclease HI